MKKVLLVLLSLFINLAIVNAVSNPYKQAGPYGTNCTWYAWKMANEKGGVNLPGWGNAKEWYNDAKEDGYSVGTTPASNSIIVWGDWTSYGHVGYIEKVEGDILYVWDSTGPCIDEEDPTYVECMANGVSEETDRACKAAAPRVACKYPISTSQYTITGYIYLNNAPKKTTTTKSEVSNKTKKEDTTTIKEVKKSSNANLSNIELSTGVIKFDKTVMNYSIEVENNIASIEVIATTEDKKASVKGTGEYELNLGLNEIKLTVTAEDKSKKEYIIKVTRKEKEVIKQDLSKNTPKKEENKKRVDNKQKIILISISCLLIIILSWLIIKKIKNRK